ncbi:MAG: acylphosphatase [Candidatus Omnitrophota bacterium]
MKGRAADAEKNKRIHVFYSGRVQGVGFRFTAEHIALSLQLVGWVKNLTDGRVEVVAEGEETKLVHFLEKMKNGPMKPYIRGVEVDWQAAKGEFDDFGVCF